MHGSKSKRFSLSNLKDASATQSLTCVLTAADVLQMANAAVAAEEAQQRSNQEQEALEGSLTEAQRHANQLESQLQQLSAAHKHLQDGSSSYQQELEGRAVMQSNCLSSDDWYSAGDAYSA